MWLFLYWIISHSCFIGVNLCLKRDAEGLLSTSPRTFVNLDSKLSFQPLVKASPGENAGSARVITLP